MNRIAKADYAALHTPVREIKRDIRKIDNKLKRLNPCGKPQMTLKNTGLSMKTACLLTRKKNYYQEFRKLGSGFESYQSKAKAFSLRT